jgi:hypothetical protein
VIKFRKGLASRRKLDICVNLRKYQARSIRLIALNAPEVNLHFRERVVFSLKTEKMTSLNLLERVPHRKRT